MQAKFLLCSATLRRGGAHVTGGSPADAAVHSGTFSYQLHIQQDLEDGTYHDEASESGEVTIDVRDINGGCTYLMQIL